MQNALKNYSRKFDAVVCLSAIDWDFLWQRTQEIMFQFACMGYPVLFVENTGVRTPRIKDVPRVLNRAKNALAKLKNRTAWARNKQYAESLKIHSPLALPFPYFKPAIKINNMLLKRRIMKFSQETGIPVNRMLMWTYMTTPLALELSNGLPWAGVVVDLVSDPCKVPGAEKLKPFHLQILQRAHLVACASKPMFDQVKTQMPSNQVDKVILIEDGFSAWLAEAADKEINVVTDASFRPTAVYIGGINQKIWWEALIHLAKNFPEVSFVLIGPKETEKLPTDELPNVTWLPPFSNYTQLGAFLKRCQVGLIPYVKDTYVAGMRPAKINEYMVMGLPIVATKLPELVRFTKEHGSGVMYVAETPEEFVFALKKALEEDCIKLRSKRRQIAHEHAWIKVCGKLEGKLHQLI
ncbi:group 1 glycosyl transferase [Thermincola ferriacetica]|uniref:Group 1 glycosyl transferase n=1 Tax=Thermincola ferriacetica TaxID=281456 RepID=A0A0L6W3I7_9FIRM|nr:glycosyltransferase [Thermincola ferriacetica]KNZ70026.1 group 1 glycosyl transferase [Thermincola ferriacetica]